MDIDVNNGALFKIGRADYGEIGVGAAALTI